MGRILTTLVFAFLAICAMHLLIPHECIKLMAQPRACVPRLVLSTRDIIVGIVWIRISCDVTFDEPHYFYPRTSYDD